MTSIAQFPGRSNAAHGLGAHWTQEAAKAECSPAFLDHESREPRFPEITQRVLPTSGLLPPERANWLNNHWFDRAAVRYAPTAMPFILSVVSVCIAPESLNGPVLLSSAMFGRSIRHFRTVSLQRNPDGLGYPVRLRVRPTNARFLKSSISQTESLSPPITPGIRSSRRGSHRIGSARFRTAWI